MSSTLVGYSSGEDEYGNDKKGGQRQSDANYQTMDMDMSDEEDSNTRQQQQHAENPANSQLFSSSADFNAYNQQFENRQNSNAFSKTNSRTEHNNAGSKLDSTSDRRDGGGKRNDSSSENESSSDRHRDTYSDRSQSYKRDRLPDSSHQSGSRKHHHHHHHRSSRDHDRDHYRRRSRSRSGDRGSSSSYSRSSRRRSRSRDRGGAGPSNNRPYRKSSRSRERERSRKLHSMGLTTGGAGTDANAASAAAVQVQSYESQLEKVKEITGVEVPKYYNPSAINPLKYAEQIKKRQMLWSKPKPAASTEQREPGCVSYVASAGSIVPQNHPPQQVVHSTEKPVVEMRSQFSAKPNTSSPLKGSYNKWESTNFGNDKANEKFRRLMGIKNAGSEVAANTEDGDNNSSSQASNTSKYYADLEQQYEKARAITHTQRGLGLGFSGMVAAANAPSSTSGASNTTTASSMHPMAKPPQKMPSRPE